MNKKVKYADNLKKNVILELLKEDKTLLEISTKYQVPKTTILDWKKIFMDNIELSINPNKSFKKYKQKVKEKEKESDDLYKQLGEVSAQLNWAKKKSKELGLEY